MQQINEAQEDNKEENAEQNNQELDNFKELSFKDYMKKKNEKEKNCCTSFCSCCCCCCCRCCPCCCCDCCLYTALLYENYDFEIIYKDAQNYKKSQGRFFQILSFLLLFLNILELYFSFKFHPKFKDLKNTHSRRLDDDYDLTYLDDFDFIEANIFSKYKLWYDLSKMEIGVQFINIIIVFSFIIFNFLIKCKFDDIRIKKEKKIGKTTTTITLINCIYFVIFAILLFLAIYLFTYSIFSFSSFTKIVEELDEGLFFFIFFKIFVWIFILIFIFSITYNFEFLLLFYLDLNFEENANDKKDNNNIDNAIKDDFNNIDEKIKKGYLFIGGKNIPIKIKTNKNLYLEQSKTGNINIFKQIKLDNIREEFVYIKIKNDAYENMLAITDWIITEPEKIYGKIYEIVKIIGSFLILFSIPLNFHANDEVVYIELKELLKKKI